MVPEGWRSTTIGKHADLITGFPFKSERYTEEDGAIRLIRGDNVVQGRIRWDDVKRWPEEVWPGMERYLLKPGDVLLAMDRTWVKAGLKCAMIIKEDVPSLLVQRVARLRGDDLLDARYLYLLFKTHGFSEYVKAVQTETAIPHISAQQIRDYPVILPPELEQAEIVRVIGDWSDAINKTIKLRDARRKYRNDLARHLLTGKRRFPECGGACKAGFCPEGWEFPETAELFRGVSRKNHGHEVVLSVTQDQGVVPRDSLDRKINMTEGNTNTYKLVEPGDFIISLRSFQGGLEYSSYRGLVSPAYHVIRPIIEIADGFYRHYFKSLEFIKRLAVAIIGIRDGKQVSYDDFSFMRIPLPPIEEQGKIAAALDSIDREIALLTKYADALTRQKKALMQKLLTGQIRVKV